MYRFLVMGLSRWLRRSEPLIERQLSTHSGHSGVEFWRGEAEKIENHPDSAVVSEKDVQDK